MSESNKPTKREIDLINLADDIITEMGDRKMAAALSVVAFRTAAVLGRELGAIEFNYMSQADFDKQKEEGGFSA